MSKIALSFKVECGVPSGLTVTNRFFEGVTTGIKGGVTGGADRQQQDG